MPISEHDLEILYRGDSREYNLTFTNSNGNAIDITDWKVYFTIKLSYMDGDSRAVIKKDITVHDDPINGKTKIILLPSDTENIKPDNYWYDIQIKRGEDNILTVIRGRIKIITDITRRVD
ncbi:hypothetical protein ES708_05620 [subsurface metagenome]